MKKVIVFFVLATFVASFSFGSVRIKPYHPVQVTQEDILAYRIINHNASANGLANPDRIWPNQQLYFYLPDGSDTIATAIWGDNQTKMVKGVIRKKDLLNPKMPVLPILEDSDQKPDSFWKKVCDFFEGIAGLGVFGFLLLLIAALAIVLFIAIIANKIRSNNKKKDAKFSEDPTKEGKPFVEGGVNNENQADSHFVNLARNSNPNLDPSNIVIKERKRVYVSTPNGQSAVVEFANGTKETFSFRNVIGWVAMVSTDGGKNFKREVFFQDCGNPVYSRTSMKDSGLIITDEPIKFGNTESENPIPGATEEKPKTIEVKKPELSTKEEERLPEVSKVSGDHALVADEFLKTQKAHKVTMKYTKSKDGDVTIESVFETKNEKTGTTEGKEN